MPWDDRVAKIQQASRLIASIEAGLRDASFAVPQDGRTVPKASELETVADSELDELLDRLPRVLTDVRRTALTGQLRDPNAKRRVMAYFDDVTGRDVLEPSLQLEWNLWRALLALDHTDQVRGNFAVDADLNPVAHAPGNRADGIAAFEDFDVLLEATLLQGRKQYAAEGEPVTFHLAAHMRRNVELSRDRAAYSLFVAPTINQEAANFFLIHASGRIPDHVTRLPLRIVPLEIRQLQFLIDLAADRQGFSQAEIRRLLDLAVDAASRTDQPGDWLSQIGEIVSSQLFVDPAL